MVNYFYFNRSNQLTTLPRELCYLPIQVLLISNNRLVALPDDLGRMEQLTELDAACNQITHLPARIGDLKNLRSLSLRNNQLVYLTRGEKYFYFYIRLFIYCDFTVNDLFYRQFFFQCFYFLIFMVTRNNLSATIVFGH